MCVCVRVCARICESERGCVCVCVSVCAKERFCILLRCLITIYGVFYYYKRSGNMYKASPNAKKMNVESFKLLKYDFKIFNVNGS